MLTYVTDSILTSDAHCLIAPVNTVGVMGKGLALEFKRAFPDMFRVYKLHCDNKTLKVGNLMFYKGNDTTRIICLFPTKEHWQNPSQLRYIDTGMQAFVKFYAEWNITSVAFPKIGCGLGGLDWEHEVHPLIQKYLGSMDLDIRIHL